MSIIREHTQATLTDIWRTIDIDALTEDSSVNFPVSTLVPPTVREVTEPEARQVATQVRQLLRGGDAEGALRLALENPVYATPTGHELAREVHMQTVVEVLQGIKASEMNGVLKSIYASPGGSECLDVLMKYLYKGMASAGSGSAPKTPTRVTPQPTGIPSQFAPRPGANPESVGAAMSVLLSWHEKVVEVAGLGCIGRVMTDFRRV